MANTDVQITLEQAVAEVLTLLTGVDLTFNPAEDTFHVVARCLNRAMRAVALEHEWSYYSSTEEVASGPLSRVSRMPACATCRSRVRTPRSRPMPLRPRRWPPRLRRSSPTT